MALAVPAPCTDGVAFGAWFTDVVNRLRPIFPGALFGFPGLSPGDAIPGLRHGFFGRAGGVSQSLSRGRR
jgi:hypothetical protein